jgi:hypothetical protein
MSQSPVILVYIAVLQEIAVIRPNVSTRCGRFFILPLYIDHTR